MCKHLTLLFWAHQRVRVGAQGSKAEERKLRSLIHWFWILIASQGTKKKE